MHPQLVRDLARSLGPVCPPDDYVEFQENITDRIMQDTYKDNAVSNAPSNF